LLCAVLFRAGFEFTFFWGALDLAGGCFLAAAVFGLLLVFVAPTFALFELAAVLPAGLFTLPAFSGVAFTSGFGFSGLDGVAALGLDSP
jgi:hypothetical protein